MATNYSQVGYGAKGSEVKTLQEMLKSNGYELDVDGVFGPKTQEAVKDYQSKNSLDVDGVVGTNTWGKLTGASSGKTSSNAAKTSAADMSFSYDDYKQSDTVQQAYALLQQQMANQPGAYTSQYSDQISALIAQITNRDKFSYDLNADALYQQYADQYTTQGKLAMMDTMGQAQAMTGGYGNSYAQSVGQQAYQGYLQQLNEVVPELYQMAYDQYNQEGQDMLNQYSLLANQDESEYGRYRDSVSDYYTQLQMAYDQYDTERSFDYSKYADDRSFAYGEFSDDRSYKYQAERDAVADKQWADEFAEAQRQYNEQMALTQEQWAWEKAQAERTTSGSNSSGGSGGNSGTGESGYELDHVSSMSSEAITNALSNYKAAGDNTGLATFLNDLVATGRIPKDMATDYYLAYETKDDKPVDTTVEAPKKKTGTTGGGAGSRSPKYNYLKG